MFFKFLGKHNAGGVKREAEPCAHHALAQRASNRHTSHEPSDLVNRQSQSGMPVVGIHRDKFLDRGRHVWKRRSLFEPSRNPTPAIPDSVWRSQSDESLASGVHATDQYFSGGGDFSGRFHVNLHSEMSSHPKKRGSCEDGRRRVSFGSTGLIRRKDMDVGGMRHPQKVC